LRRPWPVSAGPRAEHGHCTAFLEPLAGGGVLAVRRGGPRQPRADRRRYRVAERSREPGAAAVDGGAKEEGERMPGDRGSAALLVYGWV